MINYSAPIIISMIDLIILYDLARSYKKFNMSAQSFKHNRAGLNWCRLLLIANSFAFITNCIAYYVLKVPLPDILLFGRFADRYVMMFAYKVLYGDVEVIV